MSDLKLGQILVTKLKNFGKFIRKYEQYTTNKAAFMFSVAMLDHLSPELCLQFIYTNFERDNDENHTDESFVDMICESFYLDYEQISNDNSFRIRDEFCSSCFLTYLSKFH